ncbi:monovalent cation/H+ antiporter subunit D family protein [Halorussus salilacus]|uniref:monovalent cation/H+ antiporter subunit D family protein n=1 Tax=Halorussus salilacus TaxID=2953750 RepID=UPI0020A21B76|nr:monovalent cation/H+ antiporter subunit D family protein [Halorussus salilacus]USZ68682.1 monovalent cation/H+ antiporter subunit D family protein [Halorussus salilacus]
MTDLVPIAVAVPIIGSVVALLAGLVRSETGWPVALAASVAQVGLAVELARRAFVEGTIRYVVGGFEVPYGIELVIDGLSASVLVLVAVVALGVLSYARAAGPRSNAFYAAYLLLVAGLSGMTITGDLFNMYVFLEITGLAAYVLVASDDGGRSAVAALRYLLIGTVGASLFLLGIGYLYIGTGTLNMADLAGLLAEDVGHASTLARAAFAFVVVGLFIKVAVFPLHTWQPEAYAASPDSVSGLISALVSTVSAYALIRVVYTVFTADFLAANPFARDLLAAAAMVSIVAGSVLAVAQTEVKRMLAYSSVAQFGLVVAGASLANETAMVGAAVHLVGHAVVKGGLFLAAGAVATATGARTVAEYDGLADRLPVGATALGVLALTMVGIPPTVGFVGKWYIALGAVESGAWVLTAVIVASTLLTLAYFARLVERMFFREASVSSPTGEETDARPEGPTWSPTATRPPRPT